MGLCEEGIRGLSFSVLGSSSSGNSTLVTDGSSTILLDAGLPVRYTVRMVEELTDGSGVDGIFVSHEHSDHTRNLFPLAKRFSCPVYLSPPVAWFMGSGHTAEVRELHDGRSVEVGEMKVVPFLVPHDAIDPFGFVVSSGESSMALITDLGNVDDGIVEVMRNRDGLVIESNHDTDMLMCGRYPKYLKRRIMDRKGHLSNQQCQELLERVIGPRTRNIVLVHLSEENNDPLLAMETSMEVVGSRDPPPELHISYPRDATSLFRLY
ncbi:MAG: MBL fold metallo-hydrolase [Thermoplasmatota archaeon]